MLVLLLLMLLASPAYAGFCDRVEACFDPPTTTPAPSPSPKPTAAVSCEDGSLTLNAAGNVFSNRRSYDPGREYKFCVRLPSSAAAPVGYLQLGSTNGANASCNVYRVTLVAPSGAVHSLQRAVQPMALVPFELGTWGVRVRLDPDFSRCDGNPPLTMYLWWL